jgi:predicted AAA+ superfamily ATPase
MIQRPAHLLAIRTALARSQIVALIGPRQCGKTTLARELLNEDSVNYTANGNNLRFLNPHPSPPPLGEGAK